MNPTGVEPAPPQLTAGCATATPKVLVLFPALTSQ